MKTSRRTLLGTAALMSWMLACVPPDDTPTTTPPPNAGARVTALTTANTLVTFFAGTPSSVSAPIAISGLQAGEVIHGITFRPATGGLYGLGSSSRLYLINATNGAATAVGAAPLTTPLSGTVFGFDFNPTVDRIRVVSDTGQNLRLHPDMGTVAGVDTPISPPGVAISAVSYTNSAAGAPASTTLYNIDVTNNRLALQGGINGTPSPNSGALGDVGALGVDASGVAGFDILYSGGNNYGYAALTVGGVTSFYSVSLANGAATRVAPMGGGLTIKAIAVLP